MSLGFRIKPKLELERLGQPSPVRISALVSGGQSVAPPARESQKRCNCIFISYTCVYTYLYIYIYIDIDIDIDIGRYIIF